jgi:hypothetical protein
MEFCKRLRVTQFSVRARVAGHSLIVGKIEQYAE